MKIQSTLYGDIKYLVIKGNFSIGILPVDIVLFHALYRTSIKGRKDIIEIMFSNEDDDAIQKIDSSYTSRVAEIFEVILKSLGIEIE